MALNSSCPQPLSNEVTRCTPPPLASEANTPPDSVHTTCSFAGHAAVRELAPTATTAARSTATWRGRAIREVSRRGAGMATTDSVPVSDPAEVTLVSDPGGETSQFATKVTMCLHLVEYVCIDDYNRHVSSRG